MRFNTARSGKVVLSFCLLIGLAGDWRPRTAAMAAYHDLQSLPSDRILVLAPHPDDESIACAGVIQQAVKQKTPVRVVFMTYGDVNEWSFLLYQKHPVLAPGAVENMGMLRHDEAIAAAITLGLSTDDLIFLGYPDAGTLFIWYRHWRDTAPIRSILTRVTKVPYANAFRPGAPYKGEDILRDLEKIIGEFKPTKIYVSHPGDLHPDHRALYLFTRVALWDLKGAVNPKLFPYLVHCSHWPRPRGENRELPLSAPPPFDRQIAWTICPMSPEDLDVKKRAVQCHASQCNSALLSFVRKNELFGDFPTIDMRPSRFVEQSEEIGAPDKMPEFLTDEERAAYIGIEKRTVRVENGRIVVTVSLSRPLAETVRISLFFFGYKFGKPFADMPKIHVNIGVTGHKTYDMDHLLPADAITLARHAKTVTVSLPLVALGNPDRLLTSAHTYLGDVPLDGVSWRVLELGFSE
jgi:LmbE family N-acetylglucosaminyl deacetylase